MYCTALSFIWSAPSDGEYMVSAYPPAFFLPQSSESHSAFDVFPASKLTQYLLFYSLILTAADRKFQQIL